MTRRDLRLEVAGASIGSVFTGYAATSSSNGVAGTRLWRDGGPAWLPGGGGSGSNTEVAADRRIDVRVLPRDEAFAIPDIIRTATNLVPPDVKDVRIIDIVGLDQQADGGTHVASTRQVGRIEVVKIESKGKGFRRLRIRVAD